LKLARLTAPAKQELREVAKWYAGKSPDLGRDFIAEVRRVLQLLEQFPGAGSSVPYLDDPDTLRFPVRRFPYQVVYVELEEILEIIAIAGDQQKPAYWQER
jgi:plasmid stabilization system protein ParE